MKQDKSPCYECPSRSVTTDHNCHTDCGRYIEWCEGEHEHKDKIDRARDKDNMARDMLIQSVCRSGHKAHGKRVKERYR